MNGAVRPRPRVLAVQTPLLGNRVYAESLRASFARSAAFEYDAHWSTEQQDRYGATFLGRQVERFAMKSWERLRDNNLQLWTLRYELGTSYWARRTLSALLRRGRPDGLHLHAQNIALLSIDLMRRIPTVLSCDTTSYRMAEQRLEPAWRFTFAPSHALERAAFSAARAVVTFSQWAADSLVRDHGLPPERIHVIPPGVDLRMFPMGRAPGERERGTTKRLLFVGGEFERKGGPLLLDLFLERYAGRGDVELDIVTRDEVVSPHPAIRLHANVEPFGDLWRRLYAEADLFVLPTTFDQAPIAYAEAMAAGLPIVTTAVGAAAEIVRDGTTGFVVPRADRAGFATSLDRLLDDADLRRTLATNARREAERSYDGAANNARFEALLAGVVEGR